MWAVFWCVLKRDLLLAMRRRTDVLTTLFFFVIVVSLFPLGVGTERQVLQILGPGVVWVAALLASMLALERLFAADYEDGTLEQMLLTAQPLSLLGAGQGRRALAADRSAAGADRPAGRDAVPSDGRADRDHDAVAACSARRS
jgi:ABC-type transport system involved in cytochrome c biogenesis permease component